jgi:hypothetical protein
MPQMGDLLPTTKFFVNYQDSQQRSVALEGFCHLRVKTLEA